MDNPAILSDLAAHLNKDASELPADSQDTIDTIWDNIQAYILPNFAKTADSALFVKAVLRQYDYIQTDDYKNANTQSIHIGNFSVGKFKAYTKGGVSNIAPSVYDLLLKNGYMCKVGGQCGNG